MIGLLFEGHDHPVGDAGEAVIEPDPGLALKLEDQMLQGDQGEEVGGRLEIGNTLNTNYPS